MSKISIKTDFVDGEKLFAQELNNNFLVIQAGINANEENLQQVIDKAIIELDKELQAITADRGWDWNGGNRVTFYKGSTSDINNQEIKNGQMLYNTETGETALDDAGERIVTGSGNVISVSDNAPTNPATKEWIKPIIVNGTDTAEEYFRDSNNDWKKIVCEPSGDTLPIGAITQFSGSVAPTNWLICNGQAISRTTYSELFSVIGTTYGEGDGSTTFNVPDFSSRVPQGIGEGVDENGVTKNTTLGQTYGEYEHKLTIDEMPTHSHGLPNVFGNFIGGTLNQPTGTYQWHNQTTSTYNAGGDQSHSIMQPILGVNFIIKAKQSVGVVGTVTSDINNNDLSSVPNTPTVRKKVNGDILYLNQNGSKDVITLSKNKSDYRFLEVYGYEMTTGSCLYTKYDVESEKYMNLNSINVAENGALMRIISTNYVVYDTVIAPILNNAGVVHIFDKIINAQQQENSIYITKVIGHK